MTRTCWLRAGLKKAAIHADGHLRGIRFWRLGPSWRSASIFLRSVQATFPFECVMPYEPLFGVTLGTSDDEPQGFVE